ncbi:MAG TPA: hypothetical protein PKD09_15350 [Aggregatilinea sp.]|uniref:baeRF3 domain-containing protein n=1 Tax=Aggregatilinea sp. TaxID=2806333 RepID=UPI002B5834C4|nr:hypothetical protein [Aggregatilinea sp.]HML23028.1 hypothetical protein [Aggregatilinea sp.]
MDFITQDDLRTLTDTQGKWCVSIFMPSVRAGAETQQNAIRFRNLVRQAEARLVELGLRAPDVEAFLRPLADLQDDVDFWRHQSDGLAVFLAEGALLTYRVPVSFAEQIHASERFFIKPLLPLLSGDGTFYVLALSQDEIRLLEGTRDSIAEVELDGVPESLAEALWADYRDRDNQYRMNTGRARSAGGGQGGMFHGHSDSEELDKQDIKRYFQQVDRGLQDLFAEKRVPLLLAGVDYLLPIYREANSYQHLLDAGILGNPETLSAKDLHREAWGIVKPYFTQAQAGSAAQYNEHAGRNDGQASNDLKTVLRAAHEGRISALFMTLGAQEWGQFREHSYNVHVHPTRQPGDQDLLDLAAAQTLINGGTVYAVDQGEVPGGGAFAALFRY